MHNEYTARLRGPKDAPASFFVFRVLEFWILSANDTCAAVVSMQLLSRARRKSSAAMAFDKQSTTTAEVSILRTVPLALVGLIVSTASLKLITQRCYRKWSSRCSTAYH